MPAASSASRATVRETSQISAASCSTQPGLRKVLLELAVGAAGEPRLAVEDEAGGAGGALVDGEYHGREILPRDRRRRDAYTDEVGELAAAVNEARQRRPVARCSRSSSTP